MSINRHNYEEFFILYMDNELSAAEKQIVEAFVQNNPDLKDELDVLLQSKLTPDNTIVFEGKEELMKMVDDSFINLSNYEEWLSLYIDDELSIDQKKQVERFVTAHPQIRKKLSILQKAKLQPEEIVFPYKESLYRRTEKVRIVQMRWLRLRQAFGDRRWRIAAAAVLLLAIATTVVLLTNNKKIQTDQSLVKTQPNTETKETKNTVTISPDAKKENDQDKIKENSEPNKMIEPKLANNQEKTVKKSPEKKINKQEEPLIVNNENNTPSNNLPEPLDNPNTKKDFGTAKNIEPNLSPTDTDIVTKSRIPTSEEGITFAKKNEPSPSLEEGENKSSRGFFRKAVRFLEKTTGIKPANDDDKVLIGGLAVKLK